VIVTPGEEDLYNAMVVFDSESAVKTSLVVTGSKVNGGEITISVPNLTNEEVMIVINPDNQNIFSSFFQSVNNKLDEIDEKFKLTQKFEDTKNDIKGKVEEIDTKLQISKSLQEFQVNVEITMKTFGENVTKTMTPIGEKISETTKNFGENVTKTMTPIGERISETTKTIGVKVSQVLNNNDSPIV